MGGVPLPRCPDMPPPLLRHLGIPRLLTGDMIRRSRGVWDEAGAIVVACSVNVRLIAWLAGWLACILWVRNFFQ